MVVTVTDLGEIFVGILVGVSLEVFGERGEGGADDVEAVSC